jgi:hypothetical protein
MILLQRLTCPLTAKVESHDLDIFEEAVKVYCIATIVE